MKSVSIFIVFVYSLSLYSCYTPRYVYSPIAHNVPVLTQKGDNKLACFYSSNISGDETTDNRSQGLDLQGAYAFTNRFAIQASYGYRKERNGGENNTYDSVNINYTRNLIELGVGYYEDLTEHKRFYFEFFAGAGFGRSSFTDVGMTDNVFHNHYHNMSVSKIYLQPVIMGRSKNNFATSFSSRISIIQFSKIRTDYSSSELRTYKLDSLQMHPHFFWEPASVTAFGFKQFPGLQMEVQFGFSILCSRPGFDHRVFNFSAGLVMDISKLLMPSKASK
jgi:hypothetical protein